MILLLLLLLSSIFAIPSITVLNATQQNNVFYLEQDATKLQPIYINIKNNETVTYDVRLIVDSQLPIVMKYGTIVIGSGTSFTTSKITIYPQSTTVISYQYLTASVGLYTTTITFEFYNATNGTIVGTKSIIVNIKFTQQTQPQQPTQQQPSQTQQQAQEPTICLSPFRTKIKKTLFINETAEITLGVINQCHNTNITLVDVDIEGVPYTVARIKDAELGILQPGQIQYIKLYISTYNIKRPTQLSFDVIFTAKRGTKIENVVTNVELLVLSEEQFYSQPSEQPERIEKPKGALPLQVDYKLEQGYLIIKGAYYVYNNTKIYLQRANIQVIVDGTTMTYMYPIKLKPGKTYCISAIDPKQEFLPFFKCFSVTKRQLCVSLTPEGKEYKGILYYKVGTKVTISRVYDCESLDDITNYKVILNGNLYENRTLVIGNKLYTLVFKAEGYNDKTIKIRGWEPIKLLTPLPNKLGNYTIRFSGTLSNEVKVTLYRIEEGLEKKLWTKIGNEIELSLVSPGTYKLVIEAPLEEPKEFRIYLPGEEKKTSINIFEILVRIGYIVGGAIILFTIISLIIYKKYGQRSITEAAEKVMEMMKK